jgi:hypothetical protein
MGSVNVVIQTPHARGVAYRGVARDEGGQEYDRWHETEEEGAPEEGRDVEGGEPRGEGERPLEGDEEESPAS